VRYAPGTSPAPTVSSRGAEVLQTATTANRWWVYQRERFPLAAHGPLITAFSFSAVSYSTLLRGESAVPPLPSLLVAFATSLLFFLQLRIADEFKDFTEDSRFRPYRPVPRGLVSLRELGLIFALAALTQLLLALWLKPALLLLLGLTWLYLAAMSKEFFARTWLKARPVTYLWTHMLIMPLVDLYATACDWLVAGASLPSGLYWFLIVSFFNGVVIEIGRKVRAPESEENGVETYTVLWGSRGAVAAWLGALGCTAAAALLAAARVGFAVPTALVLTLLLALAALVGARFLHRPVATRARWFEPLSGVWTLVMYLTLGAVPLLLRL
jgi:4-hydroxybenzoate polyprenyltransferase